jgi:hypothetical protein
MSYTPATKLNMRILEAMLNVKAFIYIKNDNIDWNTESCPDDWSKVLDNWDVEFAQAKRERLLEDPTAENEILINTPLGYFWKREN